MSLFYREPVHSAARDEKIKTGLRRQQGTQFMNALRHQQEMMRAQAMRSDPQIQQLWNAYKKQTKGLPDQHRLTQDQFFLTIQDYQGGQGSRRTHRQGG